MNPTMGMSPDQGMGGMGLPPTDMMMPPGAPDQAAQQPNPLLALLLQLLGPSLASAANTIGQPPAMGGMPPGGMMPSLGESMQAQPTMPPPMLY